MSDLPTRTEVRNNFIKGVGGLLGGLGMFFLSSLTMLPGIIIGALIGGVGALMLGSEKDKKAGMVVLAAGAATVLAVSKIPLFTGLSNFLLIGSGIGLLALGGFSLFRFFIGLKARQ